MKRFIISVSGKFLQRLVFDLAFWIASYFILLRIFADSGKWEMIDHIYTSIFVMTLVLAVTINSWVLIPKYLNRKRYVGFFFFSILNILAGTYFNQILFDKLIDYILPGYYFISYYEYVDLLKFFFVFVALSTLFHLSWEWFQLQETRHRVVTLQKEKIDAELKALTNQVNPHFLFNSLTVLYSLSLKDSKETSTAIIKLSDILRYVIYESERGEVSLKSEMTLIQNYIDLQRYRIDQSTKINFTIDVRDENLPIMPMLFLPLVENSFKHGVKGDIANTFINISLHSSGGVVNFKIENNKSENQSVEPSGGIGLKNIEDRLRLLYANRYSFKVTQTNNLFGVELKIKVAA